MGFWNLFANSWNRGTRKPIIRNTAKSKRRSLGLESLEDRTNPTSFLSFVDPNPSAGNGFGTTILSLGSGKVAVTAPLDDAGGTDAGAVYLYNGSTGALISTISGSHANDQLGSGGLFAVGTSSTGNFLIASPLWDNGSVANAGALTFVSGSPASSITVDSTNSLVGSTANDAVGTGANVKVLTNNNYVVATPLWNGTASDVGAVTWGSGSTGVVGAISSTNSYVGATASDQIGSGGVIALSNGNYAFASPNFDTSFVNAGAATWGSGSAGSIGTVATSNSWVGAQASDRVGSGGLTALTGNGNFVISSPEWDSSDGNVGAVTGVNGASGSSGVIGTGNSFFGTTAGDLVGSGGVYALTNGNYVISSPSAANSNTGFTVYTAGAVTWSSGVSGSFLTGALDISNSIQGSTDADQIGSGGVTILNNGAFVVKSPAWSSGKGAATWSGGTSSTRVVGTVSSSNSLVGSTAGDAVGTSVVALATANGNYVVVTTSWDNTTTSTANVGAVTWGSRTAGVSGTISASNSVVGSTASDQVGSGGVTALSNGNYVVSSPLWNNGATADVGAVTWATGSALTGATVATSNSWVGSTASDQVGSGGVTALTGSDNFVIASPLWDNSATTNVGATTRLTGAATSNGTISTSNSLYGDSSNDQVGSGGITSLANGNYLVSSPLWDNGATTNAGAVTSLRGTVASAGTVSANYSIKGTTANLASLGSPSIDTANNNFYTRFTANVSGQAGGTILAGSINPTPPAITSASSTTITYGDVLSFTVTATGDPGVGSTVPGAIVFTSTTLPSGVSLNSSTGVLSGTSGSTPAGTYNFTITAANKVGSDATQSFTLTINAKTITVDGVIASNKIYDANTTASYVTAGYLFTGVVGSDVVTLDTTGASATFASANVANNITVSYAGFALSGAAAGNYILTQPSSTTANITQATLTVTGLAGNNKVYDATTAATASGTATLSGVIDGTSVTLGGTPVYAFASANVGTGISISTTGFTINNANYALTQPTLSANITLATLTVTGLTGNNKVYDATTAATASGTATLSGVISGDTVTLGGTPVYTFASPNVGTGISISTTGYTINNANYSLTQPTLSANITQATLTVTGLTGNNKVYDTTTAATATGTATLSGVIDGTSVTLAGTPTYTFASANVGSGISISTTGYTINNANYSLTQPTLSANITAATLTITADSFTKSTGTANPTLTASYSGFVGGQSSSVVSGLTLSTTTTTTSGLGSYPITPSGASAANYSISYVNGTLTVTSSTTFADPNPSSGNGFGTTLVTLSGGNVVITAPNDDAGGTNAGAVYLYNGTTGALISSLVGASAGDQIGSDGVTALANGNFVVQSSNFNGGKGAITFVNGSTGLTASVSSSNSLVGGSTTDLVGLATYPILALKNGSYVVRNPLWDGGKGAVTWGSGTAGVSGIVSSSNSLVGSNITDAVGNKAITELTNGNFVVRSPLWNSAAGAVTWGSNTTGITGAVGSSNSLIGSNPNDQVGNEIITTLTNGNFLVATPTWNNGGSIGNAGAVTWISGTTGKTKLGSFGAISDTNSIVGTTNGDAVGLSGVTALTGNNKFVVVSPNWSGNAGAVTWGDGADGSVVGAISSSNSLIGSAGSQVGSGGVTALANGNYVIASVNWDSNGGAVTLANGNGSTKGIVGIGNSFIGSSSGSYLGSSGISELSNGNYVIKSPRWTYRSLTEVGAVTFSTGTSQSNGLVGSSNSIVGSTANDKVGTSVTTLKNGNYVVVTSTWNNSRGAVTWGNGSSGTSGTVSNTNSFVGSTANDRVGGGGITVLSNNNYVVYSPTWNNGGTVAAAGAVTFGSGSSATTGEVSSTNSLVGTRANDSVGSGGVTALSDGAYAVVSPIWNSGSALSVGAVTFGSSSGVTGTISSSNSVVGSTANDQVGSGGVTVLSNGNYVIASPLWNNTKGAATLANGASATTGEVSNTNSLVGTTTGDSVSSGGVKALTANGNYVVLSPLWSSSKGAATWGNGSVTGGVKGEISSSNSLVGSTAGDSVGSGGVTAFAGGNYVVRSASWTNSGLVNAGAATWGSGSTGIAGAVSSTNSIVGTSANAGLGTVTLDAGTSSYIVSFLTESTGARVSFGFQNPAPAFTSASTATFTAGEAGSFLFTASGTPAPTYSLQSGSLPSGITLNSATGVLSGTTTAGSYTFTIRATNSAGTADQAFTLTVS